MSVREVSSSTYVDCLTFPDPEITIGDTDLRIKGTTSGTYTRPAREIEGRYSTKGEVIGTAHHLSLSPARGVGTSALLNLGTGASSPLTIHEMTPLNPDVSPR